MHAFEAGLRSLVQRALVEENLEAALRFLAFCKSYDILVPPPTPPVGGDVVIIPNDWDRQEWDRMFKRYGPPPWPGPRSGLPGKPTEEKE